MLQALVVTILVSLQPTSLEIELLVSPETEEGQRLIAQRAITACAGRYPVLGRYRFEGEQVVAPGATAAPARFRVRQELDCRDAAPAAPGGAPVPAGWQPSEAETGKAMAATRSYFAAVDAGDQPRIDTMLSDGLRTMNSPGERAGDLRRFRQEAGTPGEHRIVRVTWYVDPPGVDPGAYAAVDFERSYANFSVSCGYVIWHRQADASLLLSRVETGNAPKAAAADPADLPRVRAMLRCRD